jgi:hypothetical protein
VESFIYDVSTLLAESRHLIREMDELLAPVSDYRLEYLGLDDARGNRVRVTSKTGIIVVGFGRKEDGRRFTFMDIPNLGRGHSEQEATRIRNRE